MSDRADPTAAEPATERANRPEGDVSSSEIEARLDAFEGRLDDLDAAVQALRGYVGAIDHVNESVERRADAALAVAERLDAAGAGSSADDPKGADGDVTAAEGEPTETEGDSDGARDSDAIPRTGDRSPASDAPPTGSSLAHRAWRSDGADRRATAVADELAERADERDDDGDSAEGRGGFLASLLGR